MRRRTSSLPLLPGATIHQAEAALPYRGPEVELRQADEEDGKMFIEVCNMSHELFRYFFSSQISFYGSDVKAFSFTDHTCRLSSALLFSSTSSTSSSLVVY